MAIKKSKAPAGMNPIDAADWEKYGSFVHGEPYVSGGAIVRDAKGNLVRSERSFGSCSRSFYVGSNIKASDIKARFENGILAITLPSEKQKQIESKEMISID